MPLPGVPMTVRGGATRGRLRALAGGAAAFQHLGGRAHDGLGWRLRCAAAAAAGLRDGRCVGGIAAAARTKLRRRGRRGKNVACLSHEAAARR